VGKTAKIRDKLTQKKGIDGSILGIIRVKNVEWWSYELSTGWYRGSTSVEQELKLFDFFRDLKKQKQKTKFKISKKKKIFVPTSKYLSNSTPHVIPPCC
jgi:hypothetical protein